MSDLQCSLGKLLSYPTKQTRHFSPLVTATDDSLSGLTVIPSPQVRNIEFDVKSQKDKYQRDTDTYAHPNVGFIRTSLPMLEVRYYACGRIDGWKIDITKWAHRLRH